MRLVGSADPRRASTGAGSAAGLADRAAMRSVVTGRQRRRDRIEIGLFVSPALVLYAAFVLFPICLACYYSLYHWSGLTDVSDFIGLANYARALQDEVFQRAIGHNFTIVALSLIFQLPLAVGIALLLNRRLPGRAALRLVFFAPYVLSEVITAVTWSLLLQPHGPLDSVLHGVGLGGLIHLWLADTRIVLYTMFVVITWKYLGFGIILFLAGLQGIPGELVEAAHIDGAGPVRTLRHVMLPLLGPTTRIWAFLAVIGSIQLFDLIWIMTVGGPANATTTMATYLIDRGFRRYQFGYGNAAAVILFIVCFVFAIAYQRYVLRRDTEGALTGLVQ